jgi:hypothetical protein
MTVMLRGESDLLGFSISKALKKTAKVATAPARMTKNVVVDASKATGKGVVTAAKATGNVTASAAKATGKGVVTAAKAVGHVAMIVNRAASAAAKKVNRKVVLNNLHGDPRYLSGGLGSDAQAKTALKVTVTPLATAAVLSSVVAAPAAPLVPLLVPPIIDEVYDRVDKKLSQGKTVAQAVAEVDAEGPLAFFKTAPGLITMGGIAIVAGVFIFKGKKKGVPK